MRRRSPAFVLSFGLFAILVAGRSADAPQSLPADAERWIVMFRQRGFDLADYRSAIRAHRPVAEVEAIVRDLDAAAEREQAPFTAAVEQLGGRVLHHWWIVNGCAVELPPGQGEHLGDLPNVLRVDRDATPRPGGEPDPEPVPASTTANATAAPASTAADRWNHGIATARSTGLSGKGQGLAIMDTGQDEDCAGSQRPHRLYFAADDGTSGPGIAGSRLVRNVQIGTLSRDDRIGHGTAVAAIAAGSPWNAPGAGPGHAPDATIAGYAIAERSDGASSDATIVSAWQQIARDRATYNLVGANNSYCGSPNPTHAVQQALDSAAYNADLLVTVCAYNTGAAGTAHSQSACNGIAVGAVTADDHVVCSYSARGPLAGDVERTYPDLCAIANTIGPNPDCERSAGPWFGTSFAAPQVLGAAALVRQAAPAATALETKAILLAAALDLSAENPGSDRNATGVGMLRDDFAVATASDPHRFRSITLADDRPMRIAFPVAAGEPCAVAITWHRADVTSDTWADLDLRIVEKGEVVGAADNPRNLYEHVRFVPRHTGLCTAEIRARSLPHGPVECALAVASLPSAARPAAYRTHGSPCAGSALRAGAVLQQCNGDAVADDLLRDLQQLSATEWLFEFTAPADGLTVHGFEALLGLVDGPALATTALYLAGEHGPRQLPEVIGSMSVGRQPGWLTAQFPRPCAVPGGTKYYVALQAPGAARFTIVLRGGEPVHAFYRWPCSGVFVDGGRAPAAFRVLGGPRQSGLEPLLSNVDVPLLGQPFTLRVSQLLPGAPTLVATSIAGGDAPPIDLARFGAPGCLARVTAETLTALVGDPTGAVDLRMRVPDDARLRGVTFQQQAFAIDPAANALGIAVTHAGEGRIGDAP